MCRQSIRFSNNVLFNRPLFIQKAQMKYMAEEEDEEYTDYSDEDEDYDSEEDEDYNWDELDQDIAEMEAEFGIEEDVDNEDQEDSDSEEEWEPAQQARQSVTHRDVSRFLQNENRSIRRTFHKQPAPQFQKKSRNYRTNHR